MEGAKGGNGATSALAGYLSGLRYRDLPENVVEHAKLCILDSIGCGLYGQSQECIRILSGYVGKNDVNEAATVWATKKKSSALNAVLVNGTACHSFELDDLHTNSILHTGSVVIPVVFALAEKYSLSAEQFILAVVAGYEAGCRAGMAVGGAAHFSRGFHPQGTVGTFAAAAAAGKALGLGQEQMVHALGIAGSQAAGLMAAQFGAMAKRLHSGKAAMNGLLAAELAQMGFTGITDIFEAEFGGFLSSMTGDIQLHWLTDGLGEVFELPNTGFKVYACCASNQTAVDGIKAFLKEGLDYRQVEEVRVRSSTMTFDHVGWDYVPDTVVTAQMNMPFTVAVTMRDGEAFINQYTPETIRDPQLLELSKKVAVTADPEIDKQGPAGRHAIHITARTKDAKVYERQVTHRKGSKDNPVTKEELLNKFQVLTADYLPRRVCGDMIGWVLNIEQKGNLEKIIAVLVNK